MYFNVCTIILIFGIIGCFLLYKAEGHYSKQPRYDQNNSKTSMDVVFHALQIPPNSPTWNQHSLVFPPNGDANELTEERQLYKIIHAKRLRRAIQSSGFWFLDNIGYRSKMKPVLKEPSNKSWFLDDTGNRPVKKLAKKETNNTSWNPKDPFNRRSVPKGLKQLA